MNTPKNLKELLNWATKELKRADVTEPESSAVVLLCGVLGLSRSKLFSNLERKLTLAQKQKYFEYLKRRKNHESVWHILGYVYFWGLEFQISGDVLIPRPETEMLVENVINFVLGLNLDDKKIEILDIGTGSGAIAVTLAVELPEAKILASDVSSLALKIAKKNAKYNRVYNISFKESDLFERIDGEFDIITANLPYIPSKELESLAFEIHHYEPKIALDGGRDGLDIYRRFFKGIPKHIKNKGAIFVEIGENQGNAIRQLANKNLPNFDCQILTDFANIDRIAIIKAGGKNE